MTMVQNFPSRKTVVALGLMVLFCGLAPLAHAQTTYTWDAVGNGNGSMGDPLNWQPNGVPAFGLATDSVIFSASTNTAVMMTDDSSGDQVTNLTFDASAPAYTFTAFPDHSDNDFAIRSGTLSNQSANTQDFTGTVDVYFPGNSILNLQNGDPTTHLSVKLVSMIINGTNERITGSFDATMNDFTGTGGGSQVSMLGSGRVFITGDGTTDSRGGIGILNIGISNATTPGPYGEVQISNNNALGTGGSTSTNYTRIYGNVNSNGSLELTNNITTNEGIQVYGRGNGNGTGSITYDNALNPSIVNVSGNNTLSGPILVVTGGANYNFASNSGSLTINSNFISTGGGNRILTNQGAGNTTFTGNVGNTNAGGALSIVQLGAGTLTLGGSANVGIENIFVNSGTIAFGANAAFSYDLTGLQSIFIQNNSTLDVSAVTGGYNSNASLQGTGNVIGNVTMNAGFQVAPNNGYTLVDGNTGGGFNNVVGQLNFHNNLDLSAGATMAWKLGALSTSGPGTNYDVLSVGGTLKLGGSSMLSIDLTSLLDPSLQPGGGDPFWNTSHSWTIINSPINPGNTNFASLIGASVATGAFSTSYVPPVPGDVDHNGVVNGLDIALIAANWLATGAPGIPGDADFNGVVNGLDISLIAGNWLSSGPIGGVVLTYTPSGPGAAVPEPSTFLLAGFGLVGLVAIRRQRRK